MRPTRQKSAKKSVKSKCCQQRGSCCTQPHASIAILDITGLPAMDTQAANTLLQATKAVKLLGSQVVLTGISPCVAQTLLSIGADLGAIRTPGMLQSGIAYAKEHRDEL